MTVDEPLGARRDHAVAEMDLEQFEPGRALAAGRQTIGPEIIHAEQLPHLQHQPTSAPLARPVQAQLVELDAQAADIGGQFFGRLAVGGEQRDLFGLGAAVLERFDHFAPAGLLGVVDFAQVENLALGDLAAGQAMVFDHAPVAMFFTVFFAFVAAKEHALTFHQKPSGKGAGSSLHGVWAASSGKARRGRRISTGKLFSGARES